MLLRGKETNGSGRLRSTHDFLHGFSTLGTIFVGALIVSGIAHYGDLTAWSFSALFEHLREVAFSTWPCSLECWVWERAPMDAGAALGTSADQRRSRAGGAGFAAECYG
jgi:hypothetical protein